MKRLYSFTQSFASVQGITGELRKAGIGENRLHVMGTDTMAIAMKRKQPDRKSILVRLINRPRASRLLLAAE